MRSAVSASTPGLFTRFTRGARDVVVQAQEESRMLGHREIGTEHLLLALLAVSDTRAARAMHGVGLELVDARSDVEALVGRGRVSRAGISRSRRGPRRCWSCPCARHRLHADHIGAEHLLLVIIRDAHGPAIELLTRRGIDLGDLAAAVEREAAE